MPINIPDSFSSIGTGVLDGGGGTSQLNAIIQLTGILAGQSGDVVTLSQPDLIRKKSTALTNDATITTAGRVGSQHLFFDKWPYGDAGLIDTVKGQVCFWNGTQGLWRRVSSSAFNATLLLGLSRDTGSADRVVRRGVVRTDQDFSAVPIGSALYLGDAGIVSPTAPTTANSYERVLGWSLDQNATAGLMFFSPDVNFKTVS